MSGRAGQRWEEGVTGAMGRVSEGGVMNWGRRAGLGVTIRG